MVTEELIRSLIALHGGVRACSRELRIDHSAISRWLKGMRIESGPLLSKNIGPKKQDQLLRHVGLTRQGVDLEKVHVWFVKTWQIKDLNVAYKYFFPAGAEMRVAPWSAPTMARARKLVTKLTVPEVHAIFDGQTRVIVRTYFSHILTIQKGTFAFGTISKRYIQLDVEPKTPWIDGRPTPKQFDAAWRKEVGEPTIEDVIARIQQRGLTPSQVIDAIDKI